MANESSFMRTPLARVRGLGAARTGTAAFWRQRLTAVAMVPLTFLFVGVVLVAVGRDYNSARAIIANPVVGVLLLAFVFATIVHMQIGMQVIIEDYVHAESLKIVALMANTLFSVLVGLAALYALLKISFT